MISIFQIDAFAELARLAAQRASGPHRRHRLRHHAVHAEAGNLEHDAGVEPVGRLGEEIEGAQPDEKRPGAGQAHACLPAGDGEGVAPSRLVVVQGDVEQFHEQRTELGPGLGIEKISGLEAE